MGVKIDTYSKKRIVSLDSSMLFALGLATRDAAQGQDSNEGPQQVQTRGFGSLQRYNHRNNDRHLHTKARILDVPMVADLSWLSWIEMRERSGNFGNIGIYSVGEKCASGRKNHRDPNYIQSRDLSTSPFTRPLTRYNFYMHHYLGTLST